MRVIDPGHRYTLNHIDGNGKEYLTFIKRSGKYIKHSNEYPGTNVQEVLRVLIDRTKYLDDQLECEESKDILYYLRQSLFIYEARAYRRKMQKRNRQDVIHDVYDERYDDIPFTEWQIEHLETGKDGHIKI